MKRNTNIDDNGSSARSRTDTSASAIVRQIMLQLARFSPYTGKGVQ